MIHSAGIIPFRFNPSTGELEYFVGHPGGMSAEYYAFLKGQTNKGENTVEAAIREFLEESGAIVPDDVFDSLIPLGSVMQNPMKRVTAFGLPYGDINEEKCYSNLCDNGYTPEIDKYAWLTYDELRKITHPSHLIFYEQIKTIALSK